jgi:ABC-2 type transport system permease protein
MGKIGIIIQREYLMGVRNKAFIVLCFVAPLFFAGLIIVPTVIASQPGEDRTIVVCDNSMCPDSIGYAFIFKDTLNLKFDYGMVYKPIGEVEKFYRDSENVSVLYIPDNFMGGCDTNYEHSVGMSCILYSKTEPGMNTTHLLESIMTNQVQLDILGRNGLTREILELSKRKVSITNQVDNKVSDADVKFVAGLILGLAIYMYILIFGVRVMKSVQEEKSTRIVEVIISSVRPFQLMMGKIVAVALVALTQFTAWIVLSLLILLPVVSAINDKKLDFTKLQQNNAVTTAVVDNSGTGTVMNMEINEKTIETMDTIGSIPWGNVIPIFIFYFIFGYLMYAAIFAAMGSAADSDTDTAQFSVPVTVPLMISMASFVVVANDPHGAVAKWLSMIPFTSPVVMIMRIPYGGISIVELCISMGILVASFFLMTWLAGRVYRVGILMYGKKVSWKELGKWLFYKG